LGVFSGILAVSIKISVKYIRQFLEYLNTVSGMTYLVILFPILGIILGYFLVTKVFKKSLPKGIPEVLNILSKKEGLVSYYQGLTSFYGSILTVGFGGSVGLEAPAAQSASAFGSNLSKLFHLDHQTKILMTGCAAAATLSAIFNAPIAAVVFALEVFLLDLSTASIVPLLMASASAFLTSHVFLDEEISFHYTLEQVFDRKYLPLIIVLGVFTGYFSAFYNRMFFWFKKYFDGISSIYKRWLIIGSVIGVLLYFFPSLYGEGYEYINHILRGKEVDFWIFPVQDDNFLLFGLLFVLLIFFKAIASILTIQAGGVGGIFAPGLFIGGSLGFIISRSFNYFQMNANVGQFTLLGMAGLVSGLLHAPLTAIFLIAEITGGYKLFLPLMITAAISFLISKYYEKNSIYRKMLIASGSAYGQGKDKMILNQINLCEIIETDFQTLNVGDKLESLVLAIKRSKRNLFPVIDDEKNFVGIITLDDVREIIFNPEQYKTVNISELMFLPQARCEISITADELMAVFQKHNAWNVVITENGKYKGFISRSKMFHIYRKNVLHYTDSE
jgi:CIC family chloride channel protein